MTRMEPLVDSKKVHIETLEKLAKRTEAFNGVGWADWRFQAGAAVKTQA